MPLTHRTRLLVLPTVLGITDGVLTALALAAGAILRGASDSVDLLLAVRVGVVACATAAFTLFVADYTERRTRLLRASMQLNLTDPGRLAATNLGRIVVRESATSAAVASLASFAGAALPLLFGALLPVPPWVTLAIAVAVLGVLGWSIGSMLLASRLRWVVAMLVGGALIAVIGAVLDIA